MQTRACKIYVSASLWNSTEIILSYDRFIKLSAIHYYSIRQKQNLVYFKPHIKKAIGREMLTHIGSHLWKEIKPSIKNLE